MPALPATLAELPVAEPSWTFQDGAAPDRAAANRVLAKLDETDRRALLLSHGFGLPLGDVAFALHLDASVLSWRLRRTFELGGADHAAALERGVAAVMHERVEQARAGVAPLPAEVPEETLERLHARRAGAAPEQAKGRAGGLGVGSFVLIVLAAAGFMVYGAIRDVNPLWRGFKLARQSDYAGARQAFLEMGRQPEARAWVGLCWLAEGQFDRGLEALREPEASQFLGRFQPVESALPPFEGDPDSPALLPRGYVSLARPRFIFRAAPAGTLRLELKSGALGTTERGRTVEWPVPDTSTSNPFAALDYPSDAQPLVPGTAVWTAPGSTDRPATFVISSREQQMEMRTDLERLTHEIPRTARDVLRGQYFLRAGLYMQAGEQFARLVREYPDQAWPRQQTERVAAALGVDPAVFLR